ncbi:MAG: HD domain-containing protein [bacterium]|nr:HD domain-containing protein [bacterium]
MIYHDDPFLGDIDCSEVAPLIDHPLFQRLRFIRQLGMAFLIFPRAQHTRFDHSIGAYERTRRRMDKWRRAGILKRDAARDIEIFGLLHDIGHGPLSHVIEAVTKVGHDEKGLAILAELEKTIKRCGGDYDHIRAMFDHTNPFFKAVHDKNLGTEKFDYLERDSSVTDSGKPKFRDLPFHVTFRDGEIVVPYRDDLLDTALHIQEFYMDMYKNVYLRPSTAVLSRLMQKLVFALLEANELTEDRLWPMIDGDLSAAIMNSQQEWARDSMQRIRTRTWPRIAILIKPKQFPESDVYDGTRQLQKVFSVEMERIKKLAGYFNHNPKRLARVEQEIESQFGFPEHSIVIVPLSDTQRFKTQEVQVYSEADGITPLSRWRPAGIERLSEIADSYVCLRVAVNPDHRERLASNDISQQVVDHLFSKIS